MTGTTSRGWLVVLLLVTTSCHAQPEQAAAEATAVPAVTVSPVPEAPAADVQAQGNLALVKAAMDGIAATQNAEDFARAQSIVLQPGTDVTRQGERGDIRVVLFLNAAGALNRVDVYYPLAGRPSRAELETLSGPIRIFRQSKDSHGRAEVAASAERPALKVFAEFLGGEPQAETPVRSVSVRLR